MEPEIQPPLFAAPHDQSDAPISPETIAHAPSAQGLRFCFFGHEGLRSGWSLLLFFLLCGFAAIPGLFSAITGTVFFLLHLIGQGEGFTAPTVFFMELSGLLALLGAAALIALIERRRSLLDYNLRGPRPAVHFFSGFAAGFVALSALVGALLWGHWMHFGPLALSGATILSYGALWGAAFLLVGCYEEGIYRCFLQFTFTRGLNFWWALSIVAAALPLLLAARPGQWRLGRLCRRAARRSSLSYTPIEKGAHGAVLAGGLGHLHALRLHPHRQRRRELDRHLCRGADRLCLLRQRLRHRLGLVGHRLPRGLGLGGNLLLRHRRQRLCRHRPLTSPQPPPATLSGAAARTAPKAASWSWAVILLLLAALLAIYGRKNRVAVLLTDAAG